MTKIGDILDWSVFSIGGSATSLRGLLAAIAFQQLDVHLDGALEEKQ